MADDPIPTRVKAFLAEQIDSVVQLEVLLLLQAHPGRAFTAQQVADALRINPAWSEPQLEVLCSRGALECQRNARPIEYCYAPQTPALHETVELLAHTYGTHRVSVTTLIFSKPLNPLRSFADAFRLRKERPSG